MILTRTLGIATTALALSMFAGAQNTPQDQPTTQVAVANAVLQTELNTKTAKQGDKITARLTNTVRIAGGAELPRGTVLIGHVDQVQPSTDKGISKAVVTLDKAQLKNGKQVDLKSTLVGVFSADTPLVGQFTGPVGSVNQQPGSSHGYGMKSNVLDSNSGTLSADGKDFRLQAGTQLQLAVSTPAAAAGATGN